MSELYVATLRRRQIRWKMRQSQHEWARPLPAEKCAIVCVRCFRTHTYSWPVALVYTNRMQRSGGRIGSTSHTTLAYGSGLQHKHIIQIGKRKPEKKLCKQAKMCVFEHQDHMQMWKRNMNNKKKKNKMLERVFTAFFSIRCRLWLWNVWNYKWQRYAMMESHFHSTATAVSGERPHGWFSLLSCVGDGRAGIAFLRSTENHLTPGTANRSYHLYKSTGIVCYRCCRCRGSRDCWRWRCGKAIK